MEEGREGEGGGGRMDKITCSSSMEGIHRLSDHLFLMLTSAVNFFNE